MKKKFYKTKAFLIKSIIVLVILLTLGISFFFAPQIETDLHLKGYKNEHERASGLVFDSDYYVSFIDVGQGSCTFVKLPDGKTMLIDAGDTMHGEVVSKFLKDKNVKAIDYLIATHADLDHIGGFETVFEKFEVKTIFRPFQICGKGTSYSTFVPSEYEDLSEVYNYYVSELGTRAKISRVTTDGYARFIEAVYTETYTKDSKKVQSEIMVFYDGLKISGNGYNFEFFAPLVRDDKLKLETKSKRTGGYATIGYGTDESNDSSAIFVLDVSGSTFLFTGDAPSSASSSSKKVFEEIDFVNSLTPAERAKLSNISVYLVGHHGSKYSSSKLLVNLTNFHFAVISVSKTNDYGHPHDEALSRISASKNFESDGLLMTSKNGTISFSGKNGEVFYASEVSAKNEKYEISWYMLGSIFAGFVIVIVLAVKPKTTTNR